MKLSSSTLTSESTRTCDQNLSRIRTVSVPSNASVMKCGSHSQQESLKLAGVSLLLSFGMMVSNAAPMCAAESAIVKPTCVMGEGLGCDELSEGNPLIMKLQQRSKENKEKTLAELQDKWYQGYKDYFSFGYSKELVKTEGGKWELRDPENAVQKASRIFQEKTQKN